MQPESEPGTNQSDMRTALKVVGAENKQQVLGDLEAGSDEEAVADAVERRGSAGAQGDGEDRENTGEAEQVLVEGCCDRRGEAVKAVAGEYFEPLGVRECCDDGCHDKPPAPVSYTHLDVYKRQVEASAAGLIDVAYRTVDSPLGELLLAATPVGLIRVAFANENHDLVLEHLAAKVSPRVLRAPGRLDPAARELDEYFARRRKTCLLYTSRCV